MFKYGLITEDECGKKYIKMAANKFIITIQLLIMNIQKITKNQINI